MPDSGAIDNALMAKLGADSALLVYVPDNVYLDEADASATRFVIVSLVEEADERTFDGRSHEDARYLVKAVGLSTVTTRANMRLAAARIDALLDGGTLTVAGYGLMSMYRESRLSPQVEVDDVNTELRWFHRGGFYRVVMST